MRYSSLKDEIQRLRAEGKSYGEIRTILHMNIPKSSLSYICRTVVLPNEYTIRLRKINAYALEKGRKTAVEVNRIRREKYFELLKNINLPIARLVADKDIGKLALSMLCLGEASKYNPIKTRSFSLGSSDPRIIIIFLALLRHCFEFNIEKVRLSVQCRADQNIEKLEAYWQKLTGVPKRLFYKALVDKRTIGKPTIKKDYHGVLRVYYFDTKIQLELESLAGLVYNEVRAIWK